MRAQTIRMLVCTLVWVFGFAMCLFYDIEKSLQPVEKRCEIYQELQDVYFRHPRFQDTLCSGVSAYVRTADGSPLCRLKNPFDKRILDIVRMQSATADLLDMKNSAVKMFIYQENDTISENVRNKQIWEREIVHTTMKFALRVPNASFIDAGCNIGVYSVIAARLGLPVVSLDANLLNLLRLRLTLTGAALDASLVWNFVGSGGKLSYLNVPGDCNIGGATKFGREMQDSIPVMPVRTERLASVIVTTNVVLKLDVEGGEADFLLTSGSLFSKFKFAIVQMKWMLHRMTDTDNTTIIEFFVSRRYSAWKSPELTVLDPKVSSSWGNSDLLWVHEEFEHLVPIVRQENISSH